MARRLRKVLSVGCTFAVALGIGFAMQNGDALAARFGAEAASGAPALQAAIFGLQVTGTATRAASDGGTAAALALAAPPVAARPPIPGPAAASPPRALPVLAAVAPRDAPRPGARLRAGCAPRLSATAAPGAMVDLVLSVPCGPRAVAVVHHQGMMLSLMTDAAGEARATVPALAREAVFLAQVEALPGATATIDVPDIAGFERAVLQWQGDLGLGLHAREDGAPFGGSGHLAAGSPRSVGAAIASGGGFVTALGDAGIAQGYRAEVYSRQAGSGAALLDVEAAVTPATCGRSIAAQTIRIAPGRPASARDLTLTMPGCSAVGEYLVLSNLLRDMTLAMR